MGGSPLGQWLWGEIFTQVPPRLPKRLLPLCHSAKLKEKKSGWTQSTSVALRLTSKAWKIRSYFILLIHTNLAFKTSLNPSFQLVFIYH